MIALALVVLVVVATLAYAIGARGRDESDPVGQVAVDVLGALDVFDAEHGFLPIPEQVQVARAIAVAEHLTGTPHPIHDRGRTRP